MRIELRAFRHRLAGGMLAVAATAGAAHAATLNVPADYGTIQDAVDAAVDGDEVVVAPGLYSGDIEVIDKSITIRSGDGEPEDCTITGGFFGFLLWGAGTDTTIRGFTIRNLSRGVEINASASGTIEECIIADCTNAGGVFMNGVSLTVRDSSIHDNATINAGGGMLLTSGEVTIVRTSFEDNAVTGANAFGGGIHLGGSVSLVLADCAFRNNTAIGNSLGRGGAFYASGGGSTPLTITNSVFEGNASSERGGGLFIERRDAYLGNIEVTGNTSDASGGGGIWIDNANGLPNRVEIANALIAHNEASNGSGAGIRNFLDSTLIVTNATIVQNAVSGGLGGGLANGPGSTATLTSCIVVVNPGENIVGDGDTIVTYTHTDPGVPGEGNISGPVQFVDFGGGDYRLSGASPCIDAGNTIAYNGPALDLDGNMRAFDDPNVANTGIALSTGAIDMGAYEYQADDSCPQDITGDGVIDVADLLEMLAAWGSCP